MAQEGGGVGREGREGGGGGGSSCNLAEGSGSFGCMLPEGKEKGMGRLVLLLQDKGAEAEDGEEGKEARVFGDHCCFFILLSSVLVCLVDVPLLGVVVLVWLVTC